MILGSTRSCVNRQPQHLGLPLHRLTQASRMPQAASVAPVTAAFILAACPSLPHARLAPVGLCVSLGFRALVHLQLIVDLVARPLDRARPRRVPQLPPEPCAGRGELAAKSTVVALPEELTAASSSSTGTRHAASCASRSNGSAAASGASPSMAQPDRRCPCAMPMTVMTSTNHESISIIYK